MSDTVDECKKKYRVEKRKPAHRIPFIRSSRTAEVASGDEVTMCSWLEEGTVDWKEA